MTFVLGFTGTRWSMTPAQLAAVQLYCAHLFDWHAPKISVLHGDCRGADAQFNAWAASVGAVRECMPGPSKSWRAFTDAKPIAGPEAFHARNRRIVRKATEMIAAPREPVERPDLGGGTWSTARYAVERKKRVVLVWPDGTACIFTGQPTTAVPIEDLF